MTFTIYRIKQFSEGSNSYGVARDERWVVQSETIEAKNEEEAKEFIRQESRNCTVLPNFLQQWKDTKPEDRTKTQEEVIEMFCFTDDTYLKHRRLFLQKPNINLIAEQLKQDGVQAIATTWNFL
jgi:hypothetical protein